MVNKTYQLIVIGGGSGGVRAARLAAQKGLKTLIIEKSHWGGTCVNLGCVPKKFMVFAGDYKNYFDKAADYGWKSKNVHFTWDKLRNAINQETSRLEKIYRKILKDSGVDMISGEGHFISCNQVAVVNKTKQKETIRKFNAEKIIIASGGYPVRPSIPGKELGLVSNDMFYLKKLPRKLSIVGGGYIALEFACIFASLGTQVTLINRSKRILRDFDKELVEFSCQEMQKHLNIKLLLETNISSLEAKNKNKYPIKINLSGKYNHSINSDTVLFAIGRNPNSKDLQLENIKPQLAINKNGTILVNDYYQSSVKGIYAIGDIIDKVPLTPVAINEATMLINFNFGKIKKSEKLDYQTIATAVFCRPEISSVGLSEEQAAKTKKIDVYKKDFIPMQEAFALHKKRFFIKIICEQKTNLVLGIHLAGQGAAEIIQGFAVGYNKNITKDDLMKTIGIHPTIAEEMVSM